MNRGQSKRQSLLEAVINVLVGYWIQTLASYWVLPWFGFEISLTASMGLGVIMTFVSIVRSYLLRRAFNWWQVRQREL